MLSDRSDLSDALEDFSLFVPAEKNNVKFCISLKY